MITVIEILGQNVPAVNMWRLTAVDYEAGANGCTKEKTDSG